MEALRRPETPYTDPLNRNRPPQSPRTARSPEPMGSGPPETGADPGAAAAELEIEASSCRSFRLEWRVGARVTNVNGRGRRARGVAPGWPGGRVPRRAFRVRTPPVFGESPCHIQKAIGALNRHIAQPAAGPRLEATGVTTDRLGSMGHPALEQRHKPPPSRVTYRIQQLPRNEVKVPHVSSHILLSDPGIPAY